jgi:hypothetical protein
MMVPTYQITWHHNPQDYSMNWLYYMLICVFHITPYSLPGFWKNWKYLPFLKLKKCTWSTFHVVSTLMYKHVDQFAKYCGVFTPCKNCNIETLSHEAVFSPCRAESRSAVPWRVAQRLASLRLVCCQATAINTWMTQEWGKGHVTTSAVTSCVSTVTQQLKRRWKERFLRVR